MNKDSLYREICPEYDAFYTELYQPDEKIVVDEGSSQVPSDSEFPPVGPGCTSGRMLEYFANCG